MNVRKVDPARADTPRNTTRSAEGPAMRQKSIRLPLSIVALALVGLHANIARSEESAVAAAAVPPAAAAAPSAASLSLPDDPQLNCHDIPPQLPHVVLVAKTKEGDKYGEIPFGCVQFNDEEKLAATQLALLDSASAYLLQLKNVVRVYLDLSIPAYAARTTQKRYREQAFAVKNYLTEKGVFTHLQDVRRTHFPAAQQQTKVQAQPIQKEKPPRPPQQTATPKRPHPSAEYTYHFNKPDLTLPGDDPTLYQTSVPGGFQFVPMENVYFIHGKDNLTDRTQKVLDAVAQHVLRAGEDARLILRGHADETGNVDYNYRLTDRRAVAVRDYLVDRGVPVAQIEVFSRGELGPVDENWAREGRARNRRVEIYLVQREKTPRAASDNALP